MKTPNLLIREDRDKYPFCRSERIDTMRKEYNFYFILYRIFFIILIISFSLSNGYVFAQQQKKKKFKSAEIKMSLGSIYDSNILKYSEKYSDKFMNQEDVGRFQISTYDDLILYNSIQTSVNFQLLKKRKSKFSFIWSRRTFIKNNIKTWNYFSVGLLQDITKRADIKLFYSYIPSFYIRHFRDYDWVDTYGYAPDTFKPFSYSKEDYGFWIQNTFFTDTRFRFSFINSKYYYNVHFTEYDSNNFLYGIQLFQPILKKTKLIISGRFTTSNTKELDETIYISDYSDASYKEAGFLLGVNLKLPDFKKFNNNLDINFSWRKRYYSSKKFLDLDPLHAGRVDDKFQLYVAYNIKIHKKLKISVYYKRFQRYLNNSAEINRDFLSEERNYHQYQTGVRLIYNLKIKNKHKSKK